MRLANWWYTYHIAILSVAYVRAHVGAHVGAHVDIAASNLFPLYPCTCTVYAYYNGPCYTGSLAILEWWTGLILLSTQIYPYHLNHQCTHYQNTVHPLHLHCLIRWAWIQPFMEAPTPTPTPATFNTRSCYTRTEGAEFCSSKGRLYIQGTG